MQNRKTFPAQTHFVGVRVPEELERTLEECRNYMRSRYGCRSGQTTPVHITLIPPFTVARGVTDQYLMDLMHYAITPLVEKGRLPFEASVNGFGSFGERTLFAHVEKDGGWSCLKSSIEAEFLRNRVGDIKVEKKPFVPHLTVANRDIPQGVLQDVLSYFKTLDLEASFPVDSLCLFVKDGHRWTVEKQNTLFLT